MKKILLFLLAMFLLLGGHALSFPKQSLADGQETQQTLQGQQGRTFTGNLQAQRVLIENDGVTALASAKSVKETPKNRGTRAVIFSENFNGTTGTALPTGWITRTTTGTQTWVTSTSNAYGGSGRCAYHQDFNWGSTARSSYLITPQITLPPNENFELSLRSRIDDFGGYYGACEVRISTTTDAIASFTTIHSIPFGSYASGVWELIDDIQLGDYHGQSVYIAFVFTASWQHDWRIDDIEINSYPKPAHDMRIVSAFYPFTQIPVSQTLLPTITATAKNLGLNPLTNVQLSVEQNGTAIGTSTPLASLAPGATTTLNATTSSITVPLGTNTLKYTVSSTEFTSTPPVETAYIGTQNVYAVDNNVVAWNIGNNAPISLGNIFTITQQTELNAVEVRFSASTPTAFSVSLYAMSGNVPNATPIFTQAATKPTTAGWVRVGVPATTLAPGDYFLCANQTTTTSFSLNADGDANRVGYYINGTSFGTVNQAYGAVIGAPMVRMLVDLPANDIQLVEAIPPFFKIPIWQVNNSANALPFPASLSAKAYNVGAVAQSNIVFTASFNGVPMGTSAPVASLAPFTTSAAMTITPPAGTTYPTAAGNYNWIYSVNQTETDVTPADNSATYTLEIGDTYAIENITTWDAGVGSGSAIMAGNIFTIYEKTVVKEVIAGFSLATASVGQTVNMALFAMTGATTTAAAPLFSVPAVRPTSGLITVTVPKTVLEPGTYYLAVHQTTTTNMGLAYEVNPASARMRSRGTGTAGALTSNASFGAVLVRMVTQDFASFVDAEIVSITTPTTGSYVNLTNAETVTVVIKNNSASDISGFNMILTVNGAATTLTYSGTLTSGSTDTYTFNGVDLSAEGAYTITVSVGLTGDMEPANNSKSVTLTNVVCTPTVNALPYYYGFENGTHDSWNIPCFTQDVGTLTPTANNMWVVNQTNTSNNRAPRTGAKNATLRWNVNRWLFREVYLAPGDYKFGVWARQSNATAANAGITLRYGTAATSAGMVNTISPRVNLGNVNYQEVSGTFTVTTAGTYYVGILGEIANNTNNYISIDDIFLAECAVDAEVLAITAPTAGMHTSLSANEPVIVTLRNNGTENITAATLTLACGAVTHSETYTGNIAHSGGTVSYTFANDLDLSVDGTYTITVTIEIPGDEDPANDSQSIQVIVGPIPVVCDDVIVGTGTTTANSIPINTYYRHSYVQHIFDDTEVGGIGEITAVSFQYILGTPRTIDNISIYLGHTGKSTFTSTTDWVPVSQMQLVYTGNVSFDNTGTNFWVRIPLDASFNYAGGNLVLAVLNNSGTYTTGSSHTFYTHSTTPNNKTLRYAVDGTTLINPASPPTGTRETVRSNTMFELCPYACDPVTNLAIVYTGNCEAELTWDAPTGNSHTYNIYRNGTFITNIAATSYTDTGFDVTAGHTWGVQVACHGGGYGNSEMVSVSEGPCCNPATNFAVSYTLACEAELTWDAPAGGPHTYVIYCDGVSIATGVSGTSYTHTGFDPTVGHTWAVAVECGGGGESAAVSVTMYSCHEVLAGCDEYLVAPGVIANNWIPINTNYGNNYTQMIYEPGDIGATGNINSIKLNTLRNLTRNNVTIYMANTSKTHFAANNDWIPLSELTEVYSGSVTLVANAWIELQLNAPFEYTGGNLAVVFLSNQLNSGDGSTNSFNVHSVTTDLTINVYSDGSPGINPASPPNATGTQNFPKRRANIEFYICPIPTCDPATNLTVVYNADCDAELTWDEPAGGPHTYTISRDGASIVTGVSATSYTDMGFNIMTAHTWTVKVECPGGGESPAITASLPACSITIGACNPVNNLTAIYTPSCGALISWDDPTRRSRTYPELPVESVDKEALMAEKAARLAAEGNNAVIDSRRSNGQIVNNAPQAPAKVSVPPASRGMVNVTLEAGNVWGDGTGYQMLIGPTSLWGTTIPLTGPLAVCTHGNPNLYAPFTHKIPLAADPVCTTSNIVFNNSITIQIPAGTYAYCITNPSDDIPPYNQIWIASSDNGRKAAYVFEDGYKYTFKAQMAGLNDEVIITIEMDGDPCPAISNLTANVTGNDVDLTWTASTGTPDYYQVLRNGTSLGTVTVNSYTDLGAPDGQHNYCVKAVYPAVDDCIPMSVCQSVIVGNFCNIRIEMWDSYGDGWNGTSKIVITSNGVTYGEAKLMSGSYGAATFLVPVGDIDFSWVTGTYDSENSFKIYDFIDTELYHRPSASGLNGLFFTFNNTCVVNYYNVYRDGGIVASSITANSYLDTGFDPLASHTWTVEVICDGGGFSAPEDVTLPPCQLDDCGNVLIGTGTTGSYEIPINTFYMYSYVQQIFDAAEVGDEGEINSVFFQYIYGTSQTVQNISIYLGNTSKSTYTSNTDWVPLSAMELVYTGTVHFDNTGMDYWVNIPFDTPFDYAGGNLVLAVVDNSGSYSTGSNQTFRTHSTAPNNKTIHYRKDNTPAGPINPASPPTASGRLTVRNNVMFNVCPYACDPVTNLAAIYNTTCDAVLLTWDAPVGATYTYFYNVYRNGNLVASSLTANSYTDTGFDPYVIHTWTVKVACDDGLSAGVSVSEGPCFEGCNPITNLTVNYTTACDAILTWNAPESRGNALLVNPTVGAAITPTERNQAFTGQVQFSAPQPSLAPDNRAVILSEGFEGGTVTLPTDWVFTHTGSGSPWQIVNALYAGGVPVVAPQSGSYFATNLWNEAGPRNAWMISKGLDLTAGTEYTISFWLGLQGYQTERDKFKVCLGTAQTAAAMESGVVIYDNPGSSSVTTWTKMVFTHTPATSGTYYLGFHAYSDFDWGNDINIDDVRVSIPSTYTYSISRDGAFLGTTTATSYTDIGFDITTGHVWTVTFTCDNGDPAQPVSVTGGSCTLSCDPVTNLTAGYNANCEAELTWIEPAGGPYTFSIYRDGNPIPVASNVTSTSYTDIVPDAYVGYTWTVTVECPVGIGGESVPVAINLPPCKVIPTECEDVVIGTGTTSSYLIPINTYYMYSYVQQIFDAAQVGNHFGKISSVSFQYIHTVPQTVQNISIYLGNTTKSTFASNTDWIPVSAMELVYTGPVTFNNTGTWVNIPLDTPFDYTGDNLVLAVVDNSGTYTTGSNNTFRTHSTVPNKTIHFRKDNSPAGPINPASPPTATDRLAVRNNVVFEFCLVLGECDPATNLTAVYNADCEAVLTWDAPVGGPHTYTLYRGLDLVSSNITATSYTDTGLDAYTGYSWIVRVNCPDGTESVAAHASLPACIIPACDPVTNLTAAYNANCDAAVLTWNAPTRANTPLVIRGTAQGTAPMEKDITSIRSSGLSVSDILAKLGPKPEVQIPANRAVVFSDGFESSTGIPTASGVNPSFTPPLPTGWTLSNTGHNWGTTPNLSNVPGCGDNFAPHLGTRMMYNTWSCPGNTWAFSPGFALVAGEAYEISFWYNAMGWAADFEPDDFEVRIGTTPTAAGMSGAQLVFSQTNVYHNFDFVWRNATYNFTPTATGTYHLGFRDLRPDGTGLCLLIDDILITDAAPPATYSYNVYRDGTLAAGTVTTLTYTDTNIDATTGHTWEVTVICPDGSESMPIAVSLGACTVTPPSCDPVTNLTAAYITGGCDVQLTWDAPTRGDSRTVILFENFEGMPDGSSDGPAGWTHIDADGDGHKWYGLKNAGTPIIPGHSGTGLMTTASYQGVLPLTPDNYLITPDVTGATSVNYWVSAQDDQWAAEHYALCVSTTGTNAADFTIVFQETMTAKGGAREGDRNDPGRPQGTWYQRTVNLPAGTKYIAWRHYNCTDWFRLNLDDVTVYGATGPASYTYNVYRDGTQVASSVTTTSYTDTGNTPATGHTWTVTVNCPDGTQSAPATVSLGACSTATVGDTSITDLEIDGLSADRTGNHFSGAAECNETNVEITVFLGDPLASVLIGTTAATYTHLALYTYGPNTFTIRVTAQNGATEDYTLTIKRPMPFEIMVQERWENTLTVINNPTVNGGYSFASNQYQWYFNGNALPGATKQSYSHSPISGAKLPTGVYRVEARTTGGVDISSCSKSIAYTRSIDVIAYPNPVLSGQVITINADAELDHLQDAVVDVYSITGNRVDQIKVQGQHTPITINYAPGIYVFVLTGKDELRKEWKVVVQ